MAGRPVSAYRALASESRVSILHALQQADGALTVREVATAVGLHDNTTREHLDRLVEARFATKAPEVRSTRGRPHVLYRVAESPAVPEADVWFRENLIRVLLAGYGRRLESRAETAARAGEEQAKAWASRRPPAAREAPDEDPPEDTRDDRALTQLAVIEAHLEELGFAPDVDPLDTRIHLRHCPFLDLARGNTDVVCSVHLGIVRGVLAQHDGPLVAERLEPFVGPHHCVLHLARREVVAAL